MTNHPDEFSSDEHSRTISRTSTVYKTTVCHILSKISSEKKNEKIKPTKVSTKPLLQSRETIEDDL